MAWAPVEPAPIVVNTAAPIEPAPIVVNTAVNTQHHAALDLWRSAISPSPLPEAFKAQSQATRRAYETASDQWKDIAETTALWFTKSLEPLQSVLHRSAR